MRGVFVESDDDFPRPQIIVENSLTTSFTTGASVSMSNSITRTLPTAALPSPVPPGTPIQLESLIGGRWVLSSASRGLDTLAWPSDSVRFFTFSETGSGTENQRIYLRDFRGCLDSFDIANVAPSRKLVAAAWLEGPYDTAADTMVAALNPTPQGCHLLNHRYLHNADTAGWQGQEMPQGAAVPPTAIDIVRLDLRDGTDSSDTRGTAYGWLLSDGRIVDFASGGGLPFLNFPGDDADMPADSHRVVFRHRTHLALITRSNRYSPFDTSGTGIADFRDSMEVHQPVWCIKMDGTNALSPAGAVYDEEAVDEGYLDAQDEYVATAGRDGYTPECALDSTNCPGYPGANPTNVYELYTGTGPNGRASRASLDVTLDGVVGAEDEALTETNVGLFYTSPVDESN